MKLILIRHGETERNANHLIQGKDGGKLTPKGIEQAKKVGKELKEKYKIDIVFCSPLKRCVETLENILDEYPIEGPVLMSKLLEERDFGEYTGVEKDLMDWEEFDKDGPINREMGVESLTDLQKRVYLFLEDLKLEEVETVLVISHGGPMRTMIGKLTGKDSGDVKVENAEIMEIGDFK